MYNNKDELWILLNVDIFADAAKFTRFLLCKGNGI